MTGGQVCQHVSWEVLQAKQTVPQRKATLDRDGELTDLWALCWNFTLWVAVALLLVTCF